MPVTSVRLRDDLQEPLEAAAERLQRSKGWIINQALEAYLRNETSQERLRRETLEGLADVEAGRLFDGDEVLAWIESWGKDEELSKPRLG